ncbi:hypothetical protein MSTE_00008 [Mycobacteroides stephanolepidis]|uniref:Uncharacterized protein n=1 Tax=[Mycobacterium] stephanolepidis TaxID=1520670 RepID=A0A1Z4EQY7_9MYCO|nr:hypothetical protein [[Mycobacterium] stephanolepidis]BAX95361.1 hypothetical protein MSTE_00008 [[Mycobacterium] stephanolepidis]
MTEALDWIMQKVETRIAEMEQVRLSVEEFIATPIDELVPPVVADDQQRQPAETTKPVPRIQLPTEAEFEEDDAFAFRKPYRRTDW